MFEELKEALDIFRSSPYLMINKKEFLSTKFSKFFSFIFIIYVCTSLINEFN